MTYTKQATRSLLRMPRNEARRIKGKIAQYAEDPTSLGNNVSQLKGRPEMRLRVGDWRILFLEDDDTVQILIIDAHGSVY